MENKGTQFQRKYLWGKIVISLLMMTVCLSACGGQDTKESMGSSKQEEISMPEDSSGNGVISSGSEEPDNRIILTDEDIYIFSYTCGYFSWDQKPGRQPLLIENEEQLAFAKVRYGLDYPADYNEEDYWYYDPSFVEYFSDMESNYPLEEYAYLIHYEEVGCGGYYLHADKVVIDEDRIYFGMDDDSYTPADSDEMSFADVMGGFMHMAAVPKEYTENIIFTNVVYPDQEDL